MAKSKALSGKAMKETLLAGATVGGGIIAGNIAINMLQKLMKVDSSSPKPKQLMAPVAVAAAGAVLGIKSSNVKVKQIAAGITGTGAVHTIKAMAPNATILNGLGDADDQYLGLTPTSAIAQNQEWVYRDNSGHLAFPELGEVQPPATNNGYYVDPPAYLGESRDDSGIMGIQDAEIL